MPFLPRSSCCQFREESGWPGARRQGHQGPDAACRAPLDYQGQRPCPLPPRPLATGLTAGSSLRGTTASHPVTILLQSAVPRGTVGSGTAFPLACSGFSEWAWAKGISACTVYACFREDWRIACVDSSVCVQLCSCVGFDCCVACLTTYVSCTCEAHVWGITYRSSLWVHVGGDSAKQYIYGVDISLVMCVGVHIDGGFLCGKV